MPPSENRKAAQSRPPEPRVKLARMYRNQGVVMVPAWVRRLLRGR
jgi:hypothetical protein